MISILTIAMAASACLATVPKSPGTPQDGGPFRRVATFPVFQNTSVDVETSAEIVTSAMGGTLLIYTDSLTDNIGFVDITDPANPLPGGVLAVAGEPTSITVRGNYALACVNTSADFVNTSGELVVIDVVTRTIVRTLPLGGQPDAVAVSPDGQYAAVVIENQRDEDLGDGKPPQAPPGFVVIVDLVGPPANWSTRNVSLVGVPILFPEDPEPEFVDISVDNIAAVTLQENNHIVLIRLADGAIVQDHTAGTVDLDLIDTNENDLIEQDSSLSGIPREPDAIAWTSPFTFATADEGDLFGGSRGFTTWGPWATPLFESGNTVEHVAARIGHYPESRSENKGSEVEGIEFGHYGNLRFLFVGSERSNVVLVYQLVPSPMFGAPFPLFRQVLPTGVAPEGLHAIPERDLFVVACEADARADKYRASIVIYSRTGETTYPTILSASRPGTKVPIPWAALSGLATQGDDDTVFTVHDNYYRKSRIYEVDRASKPARITQDFVIVDTDQRLLNLLERFKYQLPGTPGFVPSDIVAADGTVNLDLEGIAALPDEVFWLASEGTGNLVNGVSNPGNQPFRSPNILVKVQVGAGGVATIVDAVIAPLALTLNQFRFGFEGVTVVGDQIYVAFQRAWTAAGDPSNRARIGRFDLQSRRWGFAYYPLDTPTSPNGGWVGLSELTYLGGNRFAVIERDDQGGTDARIKRISSFSIDGVTFVGQSQSPNFPVLSKQLEIDLIAAGSYGPTGGPIPEKQEGMTVLSDGTVLIVNDNDGVDDSSGETQLIEIDNLFP